MQLKTFFPIIASLLFAACTNTSAKTAETTNKPKPRMQVVFALDATGSMSGLIEAAKEKIWSIASSLTQTDPAPEIEVGLIFYRDRGDAFVTMMVPLSSNLDDIYARLMQIQAEGGGDTPESVNQALYEAVTKFKWDGVGKTYKTIFLVGDCPPHMDYNNDVKYPRTCQLAKEKDIVLNTILMGNNSTARRIWKEIANSNQGSFTEVNMNANDIKIPTPYDDEIARISDALDSIRYYYGSVSYKFIASEKKNKSFYIGKEANATAKAQRAEYNASASGKDVYYGANELLSDIEAKKVMLDTIKESHLPDEVKVIPAHKRKGFIESQIQKRRDLQKQLTVLFGKRKNYIEKELAKRGDKEVKESFNSVIYEKMKEQVEKKGVRLKGGVKY